MNDKIKQVKKYFKNTNLIFDIMMINYEGRNIYIRLDYFKKEKVHKVSWIDLNQVIDKKFDKYIGMQYISTKIVDMITNDISNKLSNSYDFSNPDIKDGLVELNIYLDKNYNYKFNRYIPKDATFLAVIITNIFDNLPRKMEPIFFELTSSLFNRENEYDINREFKFDLDSGDLSTIFNCEPKGKIIYLEKYDKDRYFAVVQDNNKYLVVVKYNAQDKLLQIYCSASSEMRSAYIYSVLKEIKKGKFKKFYKVYYDDNKINILERIATFNYVLCLGVKGDSLEIVNDGNIQLVPILNGSGSSNWKVLEDDNNKSLERGIKKIIEGGE